MLNNTLSDFFTVEFQLDEETKNYYRNSLHHIMIDLNTIINIDLNSEKKRSVLKRK